MTDNNELMARSEQDHYDISKMKPLDEKGFVFLDDAGKPYLCNMRGSVPWLWYWHPDNHWVSFRQIDQMGVFLLPHNLTEEQQEHYHNLNDAWMRRYIDTGV